MAADCSLDWSNFMSLLVQQLQCCQSCYYSRKLNEVFTIEQGRIQVCIMYQMVVDAWENNKAGEGDGRYVLNRSDYSFGNRSEKFSLR